MAIATPIGKLFDHGPETIFATFWGWLASYFHYAVLMFHVFHSITD